MRENPFAMQIFDFKKALAPEAALAQYSQDWQTGEEDSPAFHLPTEDAFRW